MHDRSDLSRFRAIVSLRNVAAVIACACAVQGATASVVISSGATQNMSCSNGVCAPTAKNAVLNTGDLENLLASGNVEVTTTGAGVEANDINVKADFGWSGGSALALDARKSIAVDQPVSVSGVAALAFSAGNKGALTFGKNGNITFASLSSGLTINGQAYTLVNSIKSLANAIASNPSGEVALAAGYDAGQDGTYTSTPIPTTFTGIFEGLGNAISNFSLDDESFETTDKGFFAELGTNGGTDGVIADFGLLNANVVSLVKHVTMGTLVALSFGTIRNAYATGTITETKAISLGGLVGESDGTVSGSHADVAVGKTSYASAGSLVGQNGGPISNSYANGNVGGGQDTGGLVGFSNASISNSFSTGAVSGRLVGGLVGLDYGAISESYATGDVHSGGKRSSLAGGGLVGVSEGAISNSYATGNVRGVTNADVGGLVGANGADISNSYSTGAPSGGLYVGGLIGYDGAQSGSLTDTYWDSDTSGITNLSQGAGNIPNDPGITGLTTEQLQSGLPPGFDPGVWGESANVNDGLPYLLANRPKKK